MPCGMPGRHARLLAVPALVAALTLSAIGTSEAQPPDCTAQVDVEMSVGREDVPAGPVLAVTMACRAAGTVRFFGDGAGTAALMKDVRDGAEEAVTRDGGAWQVPPREGVAELRYRLDLGIIGRAISSVGVAVARGEGVLAIASAWLVEPQLAGVAAPSIDITVKTPADTIFLAGLPQRDGVWRLRGTTVRAVGYTLFGRLQTARVTVPPPAGAPAGEEAVIDVAILDGDIGVSRQDLIEWVRRTALVAAGYWQGFTNRSMLVLLLPSAERRGVGYGRTVSGGGATVLVQIGERSGLADLQNDWVLPHALVRSGMPFLLGDAAWFMEGAATYVEPIMRARAGWKAEAEVWREWVEKLPRGLPALDSGMAGGSAYWGGALFFLLADIELRRATSGAKGIEDCLRGARRIGGPGTPTERWTLDMYVERCDRALGAPLMAGVMARYVGTARQVDLEALWRDLGVRVDGATVALDDTAPLAAIRKVIVNGPPGQASVKVPPLEN